MEHRKNRRAPQRSKRLSRSWDQIWQIKMETTLRASALSLFVLPWQRTTSAEYAAVPRNISTPLDLAKSGERTNLRLSAPLRTAITARIESSTWSRPQDRKFEPHFAQPLNFEAGCCSRRA